MDEGAIIVTDAGNQRVLRTGSGRPAHTQSRIAWRARGKPARFETFTGKHVLAGRHPIEVHAITGSGHNDAFSLVYLPVAEDSRRGRRLHARSR